MGAVFVQMPDNLGLFFHRTAIPHGDNGALPVTGQHYPLIGPDPGEVGSQVSLINPGNRGSEAPVRHLIDRAPPYPQQGRN